MRGASNVKVCWHCHGSLTAQTLVNVETRLSILQFLCTSCGRISPAGVKLHPSDVAAVNFSLTAAK